MVNLLVAYILRLCHHEIIQGNREILQIKKFISMLLTVVCYLATTVCSAGSTFNDIHHQVH